MPGLATRARLPHAALLVPFYVACAVGVIRLAKWVFPDENFFAAGSRTFLAVSVDAVVEFVVVLGFGLFWLGGIRPRDVGWRCEHFRADVVYGAVGFIVASVIVVGFAGLGGASLSSLLVEASSFTARQRILFVCVGIIGAVTEESIYRGYLQPAVVQRLGLVGGILLVALVFAAAHLQFSLLAFSAKAAVGVVFGILRGRDESLVRPACAHFLLWAFWGTI